MLKILNMKFLTMIAFLKVLTSCSSGMYPDYEKNTETVNKIIFATSKLI